MTTINGLLTQKPTSPVPRIGDKHRYSLTERISKTGKPWTKVKAEGEGYGQLYEVVTVEKTDFVDSHGNVSFNVDLILQTEGSAATEAATRGGNGKQNDTSSVVAHTKAAPSTNSGAATFWDVYRKNLVQAGETHGALLPAKVVQGMSEYEFARLNQVAAISATIQEFRR